MEKTRRKIKPIARKRRNYFYLLFAFLFAIPTAYMFLNFSPDYKLTLANFGIPILPFFLASFIACVLCITTFIFIQKAQGIIISVLILAYLILRLTGLTHWIFAAMFLSLFITIEIFILKKK